MTRKENKIFVWYHNLSNVFKYFMLAVLFFGTSGVWGPVLLAHMRGLPIDLSTLPLNITTFYISIFFAGCMDSIISRIDEASSDLKSHIIDVIGLIVLAIGLVISTLWMEGSGHFYLPLLFSCFGAYIALRLWWRNNRNKPTYNDLVRTEGGKTHGKNWPNE